MTTGAARRAFWDMMELFVLQSGCGDDHICQNS